MPTPGNDSTLHEDGAEKYPLVRLEETNKLPGGIKIRSIFFPKAHRQLRRLQGNPVPPGTKKTPDWFEYLSLLTILLNMVTLALNDPTDLDDTSSWNKRLNVIEYIFTGFFTFELLMRFWSFGPKAYIKDKWNLLDAACVASGLVSLITDIIGTGFASLTMLRMLRVL